MGYFPKRYIVFFSFFTIIIAVRVLLFYLLSLDLYSGQEVKFRTVLLEDPKINFGYQSFWGRIGGFLKSRKVLVNYKSKEVLGYGSVLNIKGIIEKKTTAYKKVLFIVHPTEITEEENNILPKFASIRNHILELIKESLKSPFSGLLAGILLGSKSEIPDDLSNSLKMTGLSHILVIDGMKITLVCGFLMKLFLAFFKRKTAVLFSIISIGIYIVLSGLEISALRAGIMAILAFTGEIFGRKYSGLYVLFIVGGLLLFWDPLLIETVGFQLSVFATAGIILLKPLIPLKGIFYDNISITLAASIATVPILFSTFGSYSLITIPIHALIMWTIPPIIILSGLGILLSFIFQPLGKILINLSLPFLWYFLKISGLFSKFPLQIKMQEFSIFLTIGWYLLLTLILFKKNVKFP